MTVNGYTSRNIPSPQVFENVLQTRMKAKAQGDKTTANALKLVCNTTYGATLNRFNDLYDPLMARSVCISGQLYLLQLAEHLYKQCKTLTITQLNTDGIMIEYDDSQQAIVTEITDEWQKRTGFDLQCDQVKQIVQKDVNNYLQVQPSGATKIKGGYLVRGESAAGAWKINNNCCIVSKAIVEYFVNGIDPEQTINGCDDPFQFQQIAKAGAKYKEAYQLIDGEPYPIQKVNRVYAAKDTRYGKLYKVKAQTDSSAKIDSLPEHCLIDNTNRVTIDQIDKQFYIDMARKRINDFKGIKPQKQKGKNTMATAKTPAVSNVYSKLLAARSMFLAAGAKKSGKNMHMKFTYFELDDIVPIAQPIFADVGLLPIVNFTDTEATMTLYNVDNVEEFITFTSPMRDLGGNMAINPIQSLGAVQTYLRRYLYMICLDIVEPDYTEANLVKPTEMPTVPAPKPTPVEVKNAPVVEVKPVATEETKPVELPKSKIPLSQAQRDAVKEQITDANGKADATQITALKNALKAYSAKCEDKESKKAATEYISKIAIETTSFKNLTKVRWEELMTEVKAKMPKE